MRLFLLRHPLPHIAPGACYGATDIPAAAGEAQRVLHQLRASASIPPDAPIYSSPLQRCAELARLLGSPTFDARLQEMNFGAWEMRRWDDIPRAEVDAWNDDLAHYRPGGGESVSEVAQRILAFRSELLRRRHEHAVIVCHAGTIRLLMACQDIFFTTHSSNIADDITNVITYEITREIALRAARTAHQIGYGKMTLLEATR